MPKISVVMPFYNGEEFLPEAIESILNQSFQDFEIIIIKEYGASENAEKIIETYANKDLRFRIINNEKRLGISASLNIGIKAAKGEYIARMDGDDICGRRRFEIQKIFMDTYKDIGICGISPTILNSPRWLVDYSSDPEIVKSDTLFFVPLKHPTIMMRKSEIEKNNLYYDEILPGVEDMELFMRAGRVTNMTNIIEPELFYYRRGEQEASVVFSKRDYDLSINILKKYYKRYFGLDISEAQMAGLISLTVWDANKEQEIQVLEEMEELFLEIKRINTETNFFKDYALDESMRHKWRKIMINMSYAYGGMKSMPKDLREKYTMGIFCERR